MIPDKITDSEETGGIETVEDNFLSIFNTSIFSGSPKNYSLSALIQFFRPLRSIQTFEVSINCALQSFFSSNMWKNLCVYIYAQSPLNTDMY